MAAIRNCLTRALLLILLLLSAAPAPAATRLIVRTQGGVGPIQALCRVFGCTMGDLGDPLGQVYLVTVLGSFPPGILANYPGVLNVEVDAPGKTMDAVNQGAVPSALHKSSP